MTWKSWRERAAPIIADVIATVGRKDMKALRRSLIDAYPWGEKKNWPYKAWRNECRWQLVGLRAIRKRISDAIKSRDTKQAKLF